VRTPICLITPPSVFLLDERVFLTLGILRVAACLEREGYVVEMLDLSGIANYEQAVKDHASRSQAKFYGITATTPQMPAASRVVAAIREGSRGVRVILGGPHPTLIHAALKREKEIGRASRAWDKLTAMFDCIVVGDGDDAIFEAIKPDAPKVIDADDPKGKLFLTSKRYEEIPFPARHLVDVSSYRYSIDGAEPALSLIGQLGCPFACAFCGGRQSAMLRRIRTRSTVSILSEIRQLVDVYGARGIMFYDDELNVSKSLVELMNGIANMNLDLRLRGFVKAELFNDLQAEAMYRAGFRWLLCGFESGSPRILENINKKATREDNSLMLRTAHKHGLKVKALCSLAHPGESMETIAETRDWLLTEKPDDFDATVISVFAGTPYFDEAIETSPMVWTYTAKNGDRLHSYEVDFSSENAGVYKGIPGEYKAYTFTDHLSAEDLVRERDRLEADVRAALGIPYNHGATGARYEASMGQLPGYILRRSEPKAVAECA
jgi:radical SAM superfamily enzyme YgiQ (UPF0313 family)